MTTDDDSIGSGRRRLGPRSAGTPEEAVHPQRDPGLSLRTSSSRRTVAERQWLAEYFKRYRASLFGIDVRDRLIELRDLMKRAHETGSKTIIAGNGGSAGIAGHCALDFTKNARVRCVCCNDAGLISGLANDCGYERWLEKALELYADRGDVAILISSSGRSANIVRAAAYARRAGLMTVTFTGFACDNPVRALGQLNFWVDSRAYNIVETTHQIWLLAVCDLLIGSAEYDVTGVAALDAGELEDARQTRRIVT